MSKVISDATVLVLSAMLQYARVHTCKKGPEQLFHTPDQDPVTQSTCNEKRAKLE